MKLRYFLWYRGTMIYRDLVSSHLVSWYLSRYLGYRATPLLVALLWYRISLRCVSACIVYKHCVRKLIRCVYEIVQRISPISLRCNYKCCIRVTRYCRPYGTRCNFYKRKTDLMAPTASGVENHLLYQMFALSCYYCAWSFCFTVTVWLSCAAVDSVALMRKHQGCVQGQHGRGQGQIILDQGLVCQGQGHKILSLGCPLGRGQSSWTPSLENTHRNVTWCYLQHWEMFLLLSWNVAQNRNKALIVDCGFLKLHCRVIM